MFRVLICLASALYCTQLKAELCENFRKAVLNPELEADKLNPASGRIRSKILRAKLLEDYDRLKELTKKDNLKITDSELNSLSTLLFYLEEAPSLRSFKHSIKKKVDGIKRDRKNLANRFVLSKEVTKELNNRTVFEKTFRDKVLIQIHKNPQIGRIKMKIPNKYRFLTFSYSGVPYIAAYQKIEGSNKIEIVYLHSHENFYTNFRKIMK